MTLSLSTKSAVLLGVSMKSLVLSGPKASKTSKAIEFYRIFLLFVSEQYRTLDEKSRAVSLNEARDALSSHKVQGFLLLAGGLSVLRPGSTRLFMLRPNST